MNVDPPTLVTLGVQLLVTGDDDHDASVAVRYRPVGESTWHDALPLFRVRPEVVVGRTVPQQFAGSIFELTPDTAYEIELHATTPRETLARRRRAVRMVAAQSIGRAMPRMTTNSRRQLSMTQTFGSGDGTCRRAF